MATTETRDRDAWAALQRFYSDEGRAEMEQLADEAVDLVNALREWGRRVEVYSHVFARNPGLPDDLWDAVADDSHYDETLGRVLAAVHDLSETLWNGHGTLHRRLLVTCAEHRAQARAARDAIGTADTAAAELLSDVQGAS